MQKRAIEVASRLRPSVSVFPPAARPRTQAETPRPTSAV
jgi:hypothetical protein